MADLQENLESLVLKAEEYFLIAKLATDRVIEQRYEQLAEQLRRRIAEAIGDGSAESLRRADDAEPIGFPDALLSPPQ